MANLLDMAKTAVVGTPGMGAVTFGAAVAGYQTWAAAGAVSGDTYSYSISDVGNAWEIGQGVYNSAGYITRNTLIASSTNNFLNLTSAAVIWQAVLAQDLEGDSGTVTQVSTGAGLTGGPITTFGTISVANAPPQNLIGNTNTVSATPTGVAMGFGLALSGGELSLGTIAEQSLLGNAATSAAAATTLAIGSGLSLSTAGTLSATAGGSQEWQAGTILAVTTSFAITAETLGLGTIAASSIFANATTAGAVPVGVPVGAGLTFSSGTLEATGGSGTVTQIIAGQGLNGGTITASGTISLETIAGSSLFGNAATAAGTMAAVAIGSGLSLSTAGTLSATGSGGVTSVVAGQGLNGGTITAAGTISLETIAATSLFGNYATAAGTMSAIAIGTNLTLTTGGTLNASGGGSSGTLIINRQTGTTYSVLSTDVGKLILQNNAATSTLTVPAPSTIGVSNTLFFENEGAGLAEVVFSSGTVNASGTVEYLGINQGLIVTNDGTNWGAIPILGANTKSASGAVGFGNANTVSNSSGYGFAAGVSNYLNGVEGFAIGTANTISSTDGVAIGTSNTIGGTDAGGFGYDNNVSGNQAQAFGAHHTVNTTSGGAYGVGCTVTGSGGSNAFGTNGSVAGSDTTGIGNAFTITGTSAVGIGTQANDRGNTRALVFSNGGPLGATSPAQFEDHTLWNSNSGTVAVTLTSDGGAASAINVGALGTKTTAMFTCNILVLDESNGNGNTYYMGTPAVIQQGTAASTTTMAGVTITAGPTLGAGLALQAAPTITADATHGGYDVTYTPPSANTHTLYASAHVHMDVLPS